MEFKIVVIYYCLVWYNKINVALVLKYVYIAYLNLQEQAAYILSERFYKRILISSPLTKHKKELIVEKIGDNKNCKCWKDDTMSYELNFDEIVKSENKMIKCLLETIQIHRKGMCYVEEPFLYNQGSKKMIESLYSTNFKELKVLDDNTCIVLIPSGYMDLAEAAFILKLEEDKLYIVGYSEEGLIKQNIYGKALNKIKKVLINI